MKAATSASKDDGRHQTTIYFLRCPKTGNTRYIGKANDSRKRLMGHIRSAVNGELKYHHGNWIRSLLSVGVAPEIKVLFKVPCDMRWQDAERFFIASARHLGFQLTNSTEGGEGLRLISEEDRERVRKSLQAAWTVPGERERFRAALKKAWVDPAVRARRIAAIAAEAATPESIARHIEIANRPDVKAAKAEALRLHYASDEAKEAISKRWKAVWSRPGMAEKKVAATKAAWADPEVAARRSAAISEGKRLGWARKKAAQAAAMKELQ